MSSIFTKVHHGVESVFGDEKHSHAHVGHVCDHLHPSTHRLHRFHSFAPRSEGNIKWFVDGASYFWAVSEALQRTKVPGDASLCRNADTGSLAGAQESIFILDWWLSPELYLRRPPAQNEQYRLDVMLKAAAERGVDINIVVYKEVEAALNLDSLVRSPDSRSHALPTASRPSDPARPSTPSTRSRSCTPTSRSSGIPTMCSPPTTSRLSWAMPSAA